MKKYLKPEFEVLMFDVEDIIQASTVAPEVPDDSVNDDSAGGEGTPDFA